MRSSLGRELKGEATSHRTPTRIRSWAQWAPLQLILRTLPLLSAQVTAGDHIPKSPRMKTCDRTGERASVTTKEGVDYAGEAWEKSVPTNIPIPLRGAL